MTDRELIGEYVKTASQQAFGELVRRHAAGVYGCARREVRDGHSAEDVTQAVFILLSQNAVRLEGYERLSAWLFKATHYCSANVLRQQARRRTHEREAAMRQQMATGCEVADWEEIWPVLDEAVRKLRAADREVVLLRFYERKSLAEVGQAMGVSEEAAKKRVQRAVEKLRGMLAKKGVVAGAAALGVVMAQNVTAAAPAGLVEAVTKVAMGAVGGGGTGSAGVIAKGAIKMMMWAKMKVAAGVIGVILMAGGMAVVIAQTGTTAPSAAVGPGVAATPNIAAQLQQVADVNRDYKGWIHNQYTMRPAGVPVTEILANMMEEHTNTVDGTWVTVRHFTGRQEITYYSPVRREVLYYSSESGEIKISSLSDELTQIYRHHALTSPVNVDQWVNGFKIEGQLPRPITHRRDGDADRYDVVLFKGVAEAKAANVKFGACYPATMTLWADPVSKRVTKIQGGEPANSLSQLTYGPPDIHDLYDLGVPRTAKIIDNRLAVDLKTVLDRLDARVAKGLGNHVALLATSDVQPDGQLDRKVGYLDVYCVQGSKWLAKQYRIGDFHNSGRPAVPTDWPLPEPKTLLAKLQNGAPLRYFIMDGDHGWAGWYDETSKSYPSSRLVQSKERSVLISTVGLAAEHIWPSRATSSLGSSDVRGQLLQDKEHPKLLGIHVEQSPPVTAEVHTNRSEKITWIDPARDDMPVEKTWRLYGPDEKTVSTETRTEYLDYARLPNGQWYPTRWRETTIQRLRNRPPVTSISQYNLQLIPDMHLDNAWFTAPK